MLLGVQMDNPYIIEETADFAVVFKPPKMHSVPLKKKEGNTLLEWYASHSPQVFDLMHRLDFETHGLILIAKTQKSFEYFKYIQDKGEFVKEYSAVCEGSTSAAVGFPPPPDFSNRESSPEKPLIVMSYFRPYGPGRKLVRPVIDDDKRHKEIAKDNGGFYRTEIVNRNGNVFTVRIKRGFRHQIRSHLSWIGFPIMNDSLYGEQRAEGEEQGILALRAHGLFFSDPASGEQRECCIEPLRELFSV